MNLINLEYNESFDYAKLTSIYYEYYPSFYHEMVRMPNLELSDYIEKYIEMILNLTKNPVPENIFRAGVGLVALHVFGFQDFNRLGRILDRIIPQQEESLVNFTSWVTGKLIHHPNADQTKYVNHLFVRINGWLHANGRRARPLAAASMLYTLADNAGSMTVMFLPRIQQDITILISKNDPMINNETVLAINKIVKAVVRYKRFELANFVNYFRELCMTIITYCKEETANVAINILEKIIKRMPELFVQYYTDIFDLIEPIYNKAVSNKLKASVVSLETMLANVDPLQFMQLIAPSYFDQINKNVENGAKNVSFCLSTLLVYNPDYCTDEIDEIKKVVIALIEKNEYTQSFEILTSYINYNVSFATIIDEHLLRILIKKPKIDESYHNFFVTLTQKISNLPENVPFLLCKRFHRDLSNHVDEKQCLELIGSLPNFLLPHDNELFPLIQESARSPDYHVRISVPKALFNIIKGQPVQSLQEIVLQELQTALSEPLIDVRIAILESLTETCPKELASPDCLMILKNFANDDSAAVKIILLDLLAKITPDNPAMVSSIARNILFENFYILKNNSSIRRKSRVARILPHIIMATSKIVKSYTSTFLDIFFAELTPKSVKYVNFMEEKTAIGLKVGFINSLALLAPLDPDKIREHAEKIIDVLCIYILPTECRELILSVLKCLTVLLSPKVSSLEIRSKCPEIYTACSLILAETRSRKVKIAALQVIGTIGVIDIHQRSPPKINLNTGYMDEQLTRLFFHPSKDTEADVDETMCLNERQKDIYYARTVTTILLHILTDPTQQDLYVPACKAFVQAIDASKFNMLPDLDLFFQIFIKLLTDETDEDTLNEYIEVLIALIQRVTFNITPYMQNILEFINSKLSLQTYPLSIVRVIHELVLSTKDAFIPYCHTTITILIDILENSKTSHEKLAVIIMETLTTMCPYAPDQVFLVITQYCDVIITEHTIVNLKTKAIQSLEKICLTNNLIDFSGIIMRSISSVLFSPSFTESSPTYQVAMSLLTTMIKYYGMTFLFECSPVLDRLHAENKETQDLIDIITSIEIGKVFPVPQPALKPTHQDDENSKKLMLSEDIILTKVATPNLGESIHLLEWLDSFIRLLIQASPCRSIRACAALANVSEDVPLELFHIAFMSTFPFISENGKDIITDSFKAILTTQQSYEKVCREIISVLVHMHKINQPLNISKDIIVKACVRYGCLAYALKLQEELYLKEPTLPVVTKLINIYLDAGQRENAIAVYNKSKDVLKDSTDILAKLQFYDHCIKPYSARYAKNKKDVKAFAGLIKSLSSTSQWKEVMEYWPDFEQLNRKTQNETATYFAEAALHLGKWDRLSDILEFTPEDSARCNIIKALKGLHEKQFDLVDECLKHGFSLIASQPITFWTEHQKLHIETILASQRLIEIKEMKEWLTSSNKAIYQDMWEQRLRTTPPNFDIWLELISNRTCITKIHDDELAHFFQLKSPTLGTSIHINTFEILFPNYNFESSPELDKLCYLIAKRNAGYKEESIRLLKSILPNTRSKLRCQCDYLYASWLVEDDDSYESNKLAFQSLAEALSLSASTPSGTRHSYDQQEKTSPSIQTYASCSSISLTPRRNLRYSNVGEYQFSKIAFTELTSNVFKIEALRKLASICCELINQDFSNTDLYVTTAIECLTECVKHSASFTDVVQLLNIFFEHAESEGIFKKTSDSIKGLPTKFLIQTTTQLLVQLSHPTRPVAQFVHDLLLDLLKEHYHTFIFSIIVLQESNNERRKTAAYEIFDEFVNMMPENAEEITLIRNALLKLAITWFDKTPQILDDILDSLDANQYENALNCLKQIKEIISNPSCQLEAAFKKEFNNSLSQIDDLIDQFSPDSPFQLNRLKAWDLKFVNEIASAVRRTKYIELQTISKELCDKKHFKFAVPGTYKPGKDINRINYFVQLASVYNSKQAPKNIVIRGEDGNLYQYLLKGHEDIRLDERIMQFFHLVNSILKKESIHKSYLIKTMVVMPISVFNGLIQWVSGTDTLKGIIETYRKLNNRVELEELDLLEELSPLYRDSYDHLPNIQKLRISRVICSKIPDTDVANFFWLKAQDAENWLKITNTFTVSTATNSIIGYIIGLGDRHPSNLLIDKLTGKVVHIDFGDSFEKAMTRKVIPETVPFRLTRMIVKAMGVVGVEGLFKTSFSEVFSILRENWRNLILVLAIFVHEPLMEIPDNQSSILAPVKIPGAEQDGVRKIGIPRSESQTDEIRLKVKHKLTGHDFGHRANPMTVEEQTDILIKIATNEYNLAKMYSGWVPFW